jgi:hypothetical protein
VEELIKMGFLSKKKQQDVQNASVIESNKAVQLPEPPKAPELVVDDGKQYQMVKVPVQFGIGVQDKESKEVYVDQEILLHVLNEIAELKQMILEASK